ncbi:acetyltransferase [Puniceicoccaceae bacterium K14]|nr:acetyltransferase [Puniceicoccaceae bacterium K14]
MKKISVYGAGGHGKVVAELASTTFGYSSVDLYDEDTTLGPNIGPWPMKGNFDSMISNLEENSHVIVGIGNIDIRRNRLQQLDKLKIQLPSLTHSSATVSQLSQIGNGTVLLANSTVNPFTTVGIGVIINTAASIDHDCNISDFCHISPGAHLGGNVTLGTSTWIGIGSIVKQGVNIGNNVIIGAGSNVLSDIPNNVVAFGNPAKIVRKIEC